MEEAYSTTTELFHSHYCGHCGFGWEHQDELCDAPTWQRAERWGAQAICPMCEEEK